MSNLTLSEELAWRGFVNQTTFDNPSKLDEKTRTFYLGFDASRPSQAIGNLAVMMMAHTFLRHGYKGVILAGGATSLIGDPGGKDSERPMQSEETVAQNVANAEVQLRKLFDGQDVTFVNNLDWTKNYSIISFLRDIGKHFSMTTLVQRDYIANRIGEGGAGISYTEFSYTLLQGMDFLYLYENLGVTLQLSGSDQWGNSISGVELIRRKKGPEAEADVWTAPLVVNKSTGKKFGKSEDGAIWLDPKMTTPYQLYQFWLNTDDEGVEDYLKIFTLLSKEELETVMQEFQANKAGRAAQKRLAYEVTKLLHGQERADSVKRVTEVLFGSGDYESLQQKDVEVIEGELPVTNAAIGTSFIEPLVATQITSSNGEARRMIEQHAVYVNGRAVNLNETWQESDFISGSFAIVRKGKNANILVKKQA
jgi:tyrosyl-tRNA synthetase